VSTVAVSTLDASLQSKVTKMLLLTDLPSAPDDKSNGMEYCQKISEQDAQLSQRDRTARWIGFGQKWKTGTEIQYFMDIIGLTSTTVT